MTQAEFDNLKIGDIINVLQHLENCCASREAHNFNGCDTVTEQAVVNKIENKVVYFTCFDTLGNGKGAYGCSHPYDGVREQVNTQILSINKTNSKKSMSSNVLDFFRNMAASAEEKLLKEFGVEDPIGTPTEAGLKLAQEIQYKTVRPQIVEVVKKMKEEQEKNKE